jgi:ethanolamine utilization protein EutQ
VVASEFKAGRLTISAPRGEAVVTPSAWSRAQELGVTIDQTSVGSCAREVDPSGVLVARGDTVHLGRFAGAGPDRNVGLLDVVSRADGAPMAAGFMSWSREDSFPWTLDYDEVDYVLEGVLQIHIGGRVVEGRSGDVLYIPKGSSIVFGTPTRVRVFYVTYPAEWTGSAPARPQK